MFEPFQLLSLKKKVSQAGCRIYQNADKLTYYVVVYIRVFRRRRSGSPRLSAPQPRTPDQSVGEGGEKP